MRHSPTQYIDIEPLTGKCVIKQQEEGDPRLDQVSVDILSVIGFGY